MSDAIRPLASLSITHVYYDPDDHLSLLCAFLALLPQGLCVVYASLIWSTREAEIALLFAGQLACEAANFVLKRIIKEERPRQIHGKGYGMPSSHAQFAAFWSVSLALFLLIRHRPRQPHLDAKSSARAKVSAAHTSWSFAERLLVSVAGLVVGGAVAWSRVYLNYHTPKQVVAGVLAGTTCALTWFAATALARHLGILSWALDLPLARWLRFRDLVVEEDPCQAGWEKWELRRVVSQAKKYS